MNRTFELNGQTYRTDDETADLLGTVVPAASDTSALHAMLYYGLRSGRIQQERVIVDGAEHVVEARRMRGELSGHVAADWDARGIVGMMNVRRPRGRKVRAVLVFSTGECRRV